MGLPMRVVSFTRRTPPVRGYLDGDVERVQRLQVNVPGLRWITVDEEIVPPCVIISLGCFGDNGGWVSKFAALRFGPDGNVRP